MEWFTERHFHTTSRLIKSAKIPTLIDSPTNKKTTFILSLCTIFRFSKSYLEFVADDVLDLVCNPSKSETCFGIGGTEEVLVNALSLCETK